MKHAELNRARVEFVRDTVVDHIAKKQPMNLRKLIDTTIVLNRILSDMEEDPKSNANVTTTVNIPIKYYIEPKLNKHA